MEKYVSRMWIVAFVVATGCTDKVTLEKAFQEAKNRIEQQYVPDKRVELLDAECYSAEGKAVILKGVTTSSEAKAALTAELKKSGYAITDSLQLLPDETSLTGKIYGIVNLSVCNMRSESDFSSEMVTQALLGTPVKILQHRNWYRIQTPDNYIAWVHRIGVWPMTKQEYNEWNAAEKVIVTSHYGFTYEKPDFSSQPVSDVVAGNRLKHEGTEGTFYKVSYPDGRKAYLAKALAMPENEWRSSLKQDAESIIRTARSLTGIPYLWAGTSSKGVDCSGFVRTVLYMHDIIMPRDASQQAYVGERIDIAPDFSNLQPGNLLFFGRPATAEKKERIVHVGIYTGNKRFIHSQGDVRTGSFDQDDELFDEYNLRRLLFATHVLDCVNANSKVNTTLTNSYYLPHR